jgi:hypothetical protein
MDVRETRYAKSGNVHVAYCIRGDDPVAACNSGATQYLPQTLTKEASVPDAGNRKQIDADMLVWRIYGVHDDYLGSRPRDEPNWTS